MTTAELGLAVDSSQLKEGTLSLRVFAGAAKAAQEAADKLVQASIKTGTAMGVIESMAKRAGVSTAEMAARIERASNSAKAGAVALAAASSPTATAGVTSTAAKLFSSYNAISLALQTVSAASAAYFAYVVSNGPTVEKTMEEQDRLLRVVKDSYDKVAQSAKRWLDQSKDVTQLQLLQQQIDLQKKLAEEVGKGISGATTYGNIGDFFKGERQIKESLLPFENAVFKLSDGFKQGAPNVREFVDEVARISLLNPALQKVGADLIASLGDASKFENSLKQVAAMMKAVSGEKLTEDDGARLDLPSKPRGRTDPFESQINSINKHIAAMKADALAVDATAGQHARLRVEAQLVEAGLRGGLSEAAVKASEGYKRLGENAQSAGDALARANISSQIKFGQSTAFLTSEDVAIAQRLKDLYPDVATAISSVEAAQMRMNSQTNQFAQSTLTPVCGDLVDLTLEIGS